MKPITHSTPPDWVGVEYSSCCPFNCDNTRLLLVRRDHFGLYDGTGNFIDDLPIAASQEPRWDRTNRNVLYFIFGNRLMKLDVSSTARREASVLKTFDEYVTISGRGESDLSSSGQIVLSGLRRDANMDVFAYDVATNTKGQVYVQTQAFDGLKLTSKNQIILSRADGIWVLA